MNANELMIGDWVRHINGTPYQVTCIKDGHFACSIPHLWEYNNKFGPIPLTAEILEKNDINYEVGFGGLFMINLTGLNCSIQFNIIHYVHELQHALRLCGIDKEIVL